MVKWVYSDISKSDMSLNYVSLSRIGTCAYEKDWQYVKIVTHNDNW